MICHNPDPIIAPKQKQLKTNCMLGLQGFHVDEPEVRVPGDHHQTEGAELKLVEVLDLLLVLAHHEPLLLLAWAVVGTASIHPSSTHG